MVVTKSMYEKTKNRDVNAVLNPILVLDDLTRISENSDGFIVANRDFDFVGICFDLGFTYRSKPIESDKFYSIPIVSYPWKPSDLQIFSDIASISTLTGRNRFLARSERYTSPVLIDVEGKKLINKEFVITNYFQLKERVCEVASRIDDIKRDFESQF